MKEHQSPPPEAGPDAEADPVWRAFVDPPGRGAPARVVALDGRERRSRRHRARPPMAARRRRARRAGVRRRDGRTAGRPRAGAAGLRRRGTRRWTRRSARRSELGHGIRRRDLVGMERRRRAVGRARRRDEEGGLVGDRRQRRRDRRGRSSPPLPGGAGPVPGLPALGRRARRDGCVTDWRVLAFPADPSHRRADARTPSAPRRRSTTGRAWPTDRSTARSRCRATPTAGRRRGSSRSSPIPSPSRSVVVGLPGPRGFGAAPPASAVLQASDDGVAYRDVAELPPDAIPARTVSFPAVTARRFRLVLSGASAADALPPVADGVRRPPVLRTVDTFEVSEFALRTGGRVHRAEAKAGFGVVRRLLRRADRPASRRRVDRSDHGRRRHRRTCTTACCAGTRPPGDWTVLRLGASLTGQTNGPRPPDATGLEVDKLDGERVRAYLDTHLRRFAIGDGDDSRTSAPRFAALLSDSIEAGPQNWTEAILDHFARRRGYDALPWLPALAGYVVGGAGGVRSVPVRLPAHDRASSSPTSTTARSRRRRIGAAWRYYAEALEDGRPQLGDDLAMRSHADVPMGAMWTFDAERGPQPDVRRRPEGRVVRRARLRQGRGSARRRSRRSTGRGRPRRARSSTSPTCSSPSASRGSASTPRRTSRSPLPRPASPSRRSSGRRSRSTRRGRASPGRGSTTSRAARRC